ncbi:MFS transporter [Actinosynnema sp. NPDC020468]|uniref:MFS transporter n=1 Tax=Actinosynnema sp. NPDC020468 TaxID=3154488 RepID=UPI0033FA0695
MLGDRRFRRFFLGYATSLTGSSPAPVAMTFAVLDVDASPTALGLVFASGVVPTIVLLPVGGVLADRVSRRAVMVGADLVCAAAQFLFAVLVVTGTARLWELMVPAAVRGGAAAFYQPALSASVPDLVPVDRLQRANSFLAPAKSVPEVAGPALAGVLVAVGGSAAVLVIDGATYLLGAVFLAGVRVPARAATARRPSILVDLREGWDAFRSRRRLWTGIVRPALWNLTVVAPFLVLGPVVARESLGGAWAWGAISAAQGAGAVLGGLVLLRVRVRRPLVTIVLVQLLWVLPLGFLALRAPVPVVAVAAFAVGVSSSVFATLWRTAEQTHVPGDVLSRVTSYELLGAFALGPVGLAAAGPVAAVVGIGPVLWFAAACQVLTSAVLLLPDVRAVRLDGRSGEGVG